MTHPSLQSTGWMMTSCPSLFDSSVLAEQKVSKREATTCALLVSNLFGTKHTVARKHRVETISILSSIFAR